MLLETRYTVVDLVNLFPKKVLIGCRVTSLLRVISNPFLEECWGTKTSLAMWYLLR